jgi:hypothetical protein
VGVVGRRYVRTVGTGGKCWFRMATFCPATKRINLEFFHSQHLAGSSARDCVGKLVETRLLSSARLDLRRLQYIGGDITRIHANRTRR